MIKEIMQETRIEKMNWWVRELMKALQKKDLLKEWLPKAFILEKEMQGEVLGETNWHKRIAKWVFMVFQGKEP